MGNNRAKGVREDLGDNFVKDIAKANRAAMGDKGCVISFWDEDDICVV